MLWFNKPLFRWIIFGAVVVAAAIRAFTSAGLSQRKAEGYDEQMWTSASIASYNMYFKGHLRSTKELDNWFPTYAWQNGLDIFTGEKWDAFNPDTIRFPYDYITLETKGGKYSSAVKYDTAKFPRKEFQWFDRDTWTFGWKAPNLGKYVMGWYIQGFAASKPDPDGYFKYFVPQSQVDTASHRYIPSTVASSAPFSYAPEEYVALARVPNVVLTFLIIAIVFLIGWFYIDFWVGAVAGLWLVANKSFFVVNIAAGLDSFATFFTTLSVLLLIITINRWRKEAPLWMLLACSGALGLSIAFAISSKLNSGILVFITMIVFGLAALFYLMKKKPAVPVKGNVLKKDAMSWKPILHLAAGGVLAGALSVFVFIALNPQVQGDPVKKIKTMRGSIDGYFTMRAGILTQNQLIDPMKKMSAGLNALYQSQKITQEQATSVNASLQQLNNGLNTDFKKKDFYTKKIGKYFERLRKVEKEYMKYDPEYQPARTAYNWVQVKENWGVSFGLMLSRTAYVAAAGENYYGTFGDLLKFRFNFLDGIFALAGMIFLFLLAYRQWKMHRALNAAAVLLIAFLIIYYGNTDFLWQDWARYFTPILPLYSLLIASGIVFGVRMAIRKRISPKATLTRS